MRSFGLPGITVALDFAVEELERVSISIELEITTSTGVCISSLTCRSNDKLAWEKLTHLIQRSSRAIDI
jgi:hypothetical protein